MDPIEQIILELTAAAGPGKSIAPAEVAQRLGERWQSHLTQVKLAAIRLAKAGRIDILRKGKPVANLEEVRGVIRLRAALAHQE